MTRISMISRALAPLAVALTVSVLASAADAAPYNRLCSGALCFHKDTQGYTNDKTYFFMTFNGGKVTHYNIRYTEFGGREVQYEVRTFANSNKSGEVAIGGTPGKKYYISIQACTTKPSGPFGISKRSVCTGWARFGYFAV